MLNFEDFAVLSFDCYGTLIDWESGLWNALRPILADHQLSLSAERALELYGELESEAERGAYRAYRDVLGRVNAIWARSADEAFLVVAGRRLRLE